MNKRKSFLDEQVPTIRKRNVAAYEKSPMRRLLDVPSISFELLRRLRPRQIILLCTMSKKLTKEVCDREPEIKKKMAKISHIPKHHLTTMLYDPSMAKFSFGDFEAKYDEALYQKVLTFFDEMHQFMIMYRKYEDTSLKIYEEKNISKFTSSIVIDDTIGSKMSNVETFPFPVSATHFEFKSGWYNPFHSTKSNHPARFRRIIRLTRYHQIGLYTLTMKIETNEAFYKLDKGSYYYNEEDNLYYYGNLDDVSRIYPERELDSDDDDYDEFDREKYKKKRERLEKMISNKTLFLRLSDIFNLGFQDLFHRVVWLKKVFGNHELILSNRQVNLNRSDLENRKTEMTNIVAKLVDDDAFGLKNLLKEVEDWGKLDLPYLEADYLEKQQEQRTENDQKIAWIKEEYRRRGWTDSIYKLDYLTVDERESLLEKLADSEQEDETETSDDEETETTSSEEE